MRHSSSAPPAPGSLSAPSRCGADAGIALRPDIFELAEEFRARRRVQIRDFLTQAFARRLHERLAGWQEWGLVTRIQGQHRVFDAAGMDALGLEKRAAFHELVAAEARAGFQYLYERFPLYDRGRAGQLADPLLIEAYGLMRNEAFLDLARRITGEPAIAFADGQLTRYRRGHFLTLHDDRAEGLGRIAAYVLNLTPGWAADFGGQLQFTDAEGRTEEVVTPRLNTLSVFAVPHPHLVSAVAPFVQGARYALTGWFRSGGEPGAHEFGGQDD